MEELISVDHGGDSEASRGQRIFHPNHAGREAYANRIGQGDVRRERQSHFQTGSGRDRPIKIKEHAASADILSFGVELASTFQADNHREAHIKAPHRPSFWCIGLHGSPGREWQHMARGHPLETRWENCCHSIYRIILGLQGQNVGWEARSSLSDNNPLQQAVFAVRCGIFVNSLVHLSTIREQADWCGCVCPMWRMLPVPLGWRTVARSARRVTWGSRLDLPIRQMFK